MKALFIKRKPFTTKTQRHEEKEIKTFVTTKTRPQRPLTALKTLGAQRHKEKHVCHPERSEGSPSFIGEHGAFRANGMLRFAQHDKSIC